MGLNWAQGLRNASESLGVLGNYYAKKEESDDNAREQAQRDAANHAFELALHKSDNEAALQRTNVDLAARTEDRAAAREEHESDRAENAAQHKADRAESAAQRGADRAESAKQRELDRQARGEGMTLTVQDHLLAAAEKHLNDTQAAMDNQLAKWDQANKPPAFPTPDSTAKHEAARLQAQQEIEKRFTDRITKAQADVDQQRASIQSMQGDKYPAYAARTSGPPAPESKAAPAAADSREALVSLVTDRFKGSAQAPTPESVADALKTQGAKFYKTQGELNADINKVMAAAGGKPASQPKALAPPTTASAPATPPPKPAPAPAPYQSDGGGGGSDIPPNMPDPASGALPPAPEKKPVAVAATRDNKLIPDDGTGKQEFLPTKIGTGPGEVSATKVAVQLADQFQGNPDREAMKVAAAKMGLTTKQMEDVVQSAMNLIEARKNPTLSNLAQRTMTFLN